MCIQTENCNLYPPTMRDLTFTTAAREGLAEEIAARPGEPIVVRVENSSAIPAESLHGRKEDVGRSVRLTVRQVLARAPNLAAA